MINLINRICNWNAARYEQKFDHNLAFRLLDEELNEFLEASKQNNKVEQVDALVDIIYVAIGALWKLGFNSCQIATAITIVCNSNDSKAIKKTPIHLKANIDKGEDYISPTKALTLLVKELN